MSQDSAGEVFSQLLDHMVGELEFLCADAIQEGFEMSAEDCVQQCLLGLSALVFASIELEGGHHGPPRRQHAGQVAGSRTAYVLSRESRSRCPFARRRNSQTAASGVAFAGVVSPQCLTHTASATHTSRPNAADTRHSRRFGHRDFS